MDWLEHLFLIPENATGLIALLTLIRRVVAFIGVIVIVWGAAVAACHFFTGYKPNKTKRHSIDLIRLQFGRTIILGLEFIVAADVIETTTAPDYYTLGILAGLVGIRTLLTFFMNREMITLGHRR